MSNVAGDTPSAAARAIRSSVSTRRSPFSMRPSPSTGIGRPVASRRRATSANVRFCCSRKRFTFSATVLPVGPSSFFFPAIPA
ncbi:hypothetical protein NFA_2400 [Nocardia farcinica IFM 10152]|uniref:Uncharacterized protein n=1 Tax=Nocardia farcinica (strain IFM 10152) TaxID=247156 RepID=Q5Z3A9_NOCFA|nr:hypothetical protein NFA_2400 [Nocardia farcinica IFM 10152]